MIIENYLNRPLIDPITYLGSRSDVVSLTSNATEEVIPLSDVQIMQVNQLTEIGSPEKDVDIYVIEEPAYEEKVEYT